MPVVEAVAHGTFGMTMTLGAGVRAHSEHGDEDPGVTDLAGAALDDGDGVSGVVDEQLLAS